MESTPDVQAPVVTRGDRSFRLTSHALTVAAAREFCGGFEEGTLRFFDAVLPHCTRMVDFGAYIGLTALYAATHVETVFAFEPSPVSYELLTRNVAENPDLAPRIRLFRHGLGASDAMVTLYAKSVADSGASIFRDVEREGLVSARPDAVIPLRDAAAVLREIGIDRHSLLKIDIEGAEYDVLRAIAPLLADAKPWLHVSFHPFNLVAPGDAYHSALLRLRSALAVAEALAPYRFMHFYADDAWCTIGPAERMDFLRQYLLSAKPVPRIATPQYGFVHGIAFSDETLPAGACFVACS
ncbi:MAG TPA: FkbM family methyltransferase [Acetobacteraceae bacterium]|nr:FkbM family methyltransferase [Acetobacteraceae bacterium]